MRTGRRLPKPKLGRSSPRSLASRRSAPGFRCKSRMLRRLMRPRVPRRAGRSAMASSGGRRSVETCGDRPPQTRPHNPNLADLYLRRFYRGY